MEFSKDLTDVGRKLVECCNNGREREALETLYAEDAVSVEALAMPGMGAEAKGLEAIRGKHDWWYGAHEVHSTSAEGPYFHGDDRFAVRFSMDVTTKETGERMQAEEIGEYTVKNGKIVKETFFYSGG